MELLSSIAFLVGCGLLGATCVVPPNASGISVESFASSSSDVTVITTIDGSTTKRTFAAPYGISTSVVEQTNGGTTTASATTTPLTQTDLTKMRQQFQEEQQQMDRLMADQQRLFQDMWNNIPPLP